MSRAKKNYEYYIITHKHSQAIFKRKGNTYYKLYKWNVSGEKKIRDSSFIAYWKETNEFLPLTLELLIKYYWSVVKRDEYFTDWRYIKEFLEQG